MTTKCWNGGKYGASGFTAAAGFPTTVCVPPTVCTTVLSVILRFFGCGNFENSTPGAANTAPVQSKSSGL